MAINRRTAIQRTALLIGGLLSSGTIASILEGCTTVPADNWHPKFFTPEEVADMEAFVERLIPATDTPGARDAGVHRFMDAMLADVAEPEDQQAFKVGMEHFRQEAVRRYGQVFAQCEATQQDELIGVWEQKVFAPNADEQSVDVKFYKSAKQLVFLGFFTSEVGATQVLQYDPIPGVYRGCLPLEQVGRAWAI